MGLTFKNTGWIPKNLNSGLIVLICGTLVFLISGTVLLGWFFDLPSLVRIKPYWVPMVVNTAICCYLSSTALIFSFIFKQDVALSVQKAISLAVLIIASLVMIEIVFGINLNIDSAELHRPLQPEYTNPGRMAPNTALALILLSLGLLVSSNKKIKPAKRGQIIQTLGTGVLILGLTGAISYWLNLEYLYNWTGIVRMSVPTAACMTLLGVALLNLGARSSQQETRDKDTSVRKVYYTSIFVITLICLAAGVAGFAVLAQRADDLIADNLLQAAKDRMFFFNTGIEARSERAILVSKDPRFAALVSQLNAKPDDQILQKQLASLSQPLIKNGFAAITFQGVNGEIWQGVGELSQQNKFVVPFRGNYSGSLLWDSGYVLHSKTALHNSAGVTVGFMHAEQSLRALNHLRERTVLSGSSRDMVICTADGNFLNCFPSNIESKPFRVPKYYQNQRLPMSYALDLNETGIRTALDYRGRRVLAAYGPIANTGLGMVIKIDIAEIYSPIKEQLQKAALFILALLILGLWLIRKHLLPLVKNIDSARAQAEHEKARFIVAAEGGFDSFYIFDAVRNKQNEIVDFRCSFINQRASEFIYKKPGEFVGKLLCEELPFARGPMHFDKLKYVIETGEPIYDELMIEDSQVQPSWISRQIVKLGDGAAVTTRDITKQKDTENYMRHVAMHDVLTGLPNRALYEDRVQVALEHAKRDKQQFAIALIDVDYFKRVNDTFGHHVGDILLKQLAAILTKNIRPSDTVGRLGGDEFALVLPNVLHPEGSSIVLAKIFNALEESIMVEGNELLISISVGIAAYPDDGADMATLIRRADEAMYDAKAAGRNNFQIYKNQKNT